MHVIGNTGMVGGYQHVANSERKSAVIWKCVTVVSMIGLVVFGVLAFVGTEAADFSWSKLGGRVFAAATIGILAAFAARQSAWHDDRERYNRRMELELASIDPYLANLPKDIQDKVKEVLAERFFGQKEPAKGAKRSETSGTSLDLARLASALAEAQKKGT